MVIYILTIRVLLYNLFRHSSWHSDFPLFYQNVICVNVPCSSFLKISVKHIHSIWPGKSIITIKNKHDLIWLAMQFGSHSLAMHRPVILLIDNEIKPRFVKLLLFDIRPDKLSCFVWWCIINIDNSVVVVLLSKNWVEVKLVSVIKNIVIASDNYAKR